MEYKSNRQGSLFKDLGEAIRMKRLSLRKTQMEIAKDTGATHHTYMVKVERGKVKRFDVYFKIANYMGIDVQYRIIDLSHPPQEK